MATFSNNNGKMFLYGQGGELYGYGDTRNNLFRRVIGEIGKKTTRKLDKTRKTGHRMQVRNELRNEM